MAQQDTGLGWNAKNDWLLYTAAQDFAGYATYVSDSFPSDQPIPVVGENASDQAIVAGGFWLAEYISGNDTMRIYMASVEDSPAFVYVRSDATWQAGIIGTILNQRVTWVAKAVNRDYYTGRFTAMIGNSNPTYPGLWYTDGPRYFGSDINVPLLTTDEALASITISSITFSKTNAGYAVVATAKWLTEAGVTVTTPVLISSDTALTDMTETSGQHNIAKLNILYNGVRFYMSFFDVVNKDITSLFPAANLTQFGASSLEKVFRIIASESFANIQITVSPDPYSQEGGASGEEGGDGEDQEDDPVEEETLPVPSVAGHGFCTIYVPSAQELGQMSSYLWSGAFDVDQVIKLFSNPMDSILGLSAVPVDLVGTSEQIYLGGVALTGITMPKYTGRTSVKVDFGTMTVEERWGSYLDYEPYTQFSIYLPFIGIKPVKADDIMGKTINLTYAIDILSGGCVAYIRPSGGSVLYEWSGQCALQIPVTARNYDNVFQTAMSVVGAVGAAVVAPASAPVLSGAVASAAVQAAATKPRIERSGTVNGITGFLGQLRPYLLRTIPEAYIPADQNKFIGYPAYINVALSAISGYNEVDSIHLENVTATGAELEEIESILKSGVIF